MTIPIYTSELVRNGISAGAWQAMGFRERKTVATMILSQRPAADAHSRQQAQLLEMNNPNAVGALRLVLDTARSTGH